MAKIVVKSGFWSLLLVLMLGFSLLAACSQANAPADQPQDAGAEAPRAPERDYFKVGVITSLSGQNVWGGNVTRRGYEMWEDAVNRGGGIEVNGEEYRVQLVFADAQSDPATGADAMERMIQEEQVDFILGPYSSAVTLAVAPIAEKYRVPVITGSAESPQIWQEGFVYTFGTVPAADKIAGSPILTLANDADPKPQSMFILALDDPFNAATGDEYQRQAEESGIEVLGYDVVPTDTIDWVPIVTKAKSTGAEIFAMATHLSGALELMKAAKEVDYNPQAFVQHAGMGYADFLELGADAGYVLGATVWTPTTEYDGELPVFGSSSEFFTRYQERYNRAVPEYTEAASAATGIAFQTVVEDLDLVPPLDESERMALVEGLEDLDIMTFYGPINYATEGDHYHNNTELTSLTLQIQDGEHVIVGPGNLGQVPLRYPTPAWSER